ncbi:gliding motility-associated C-terminal domain-containing protein [Adhaeribacter sp. BT258]|uniref:Gliding motility-associated C-terminal domain-containing protein n=1 Tax=Adhaeribacter terrigena TaxID=2793070 RepID=A0ABS1C559_9BACT|nr:gliding motility-associated C-terminal domain-containing protein [Adhaeribacter terrigena]MBK0404530.1 gliding motility-associated C-terminal domain-containing protein [Adhaeribacter terrigena]
MQNPQDRQRYYIFLNTFFDELQVAEIDMRLNNSFGDVVPNSLKLLSAQVGRGMAAMLHQNKRDYWLLSMNFSGDSLLAFPVNANGIGAPVVSAINKKLWAGGRLKSSPNSELLVVSGKQSVEIFGFNRQTGNVSALHSLIIPDSAKQQAFSFSFSPNSSKLYVGTMSKVSSNASYALLQYDLAAGNSPQIQQSVTTIYHPSFIGFGQIQIWDMQLAMDGKIYAVREDSTNTPPPYYLSQISYPDQKGIACGFKLNTIPSTGIVTSLPALNQTLFRNAGILQAQANRDTICYGDSVQLSAYGAGAERFRWDIADGLTSPNDTLANPVVWPTKTTTYRVIASSPFRADTAFIKVVVRANAEMKISGPMQVYRFAEEQEYRVSGQTTGNSLRWQVSGGEIISGQGTNRIRVNWGETAAATVTVLETNDETCDYAATLKVAVSGSPPPLFYNIITPNVDHKNDAFVIGNLKNYAENELVIYNRWGVEVFRSRNYKNDWQADNLSSGTYFYRFQSGLQSWKGWLEVAK